MNDLPRIGKSNNSHVLVRNRDKDVIHHLNYSVACFHVSADYFGIKRTQNEFIVIWTKRHAASANHELIEYLPCICEASYLNTIAIHSLQLAVTLKFVKCFDIVVPNYVILHCSFQVNLLFHCEICAQKINFDVKIGASEGLIGGGEHSKFARSQTATTLELTTSIAVEKSLNVRKLCDDIAENTKQIGILRITNNLSFGFIDVFRSVLTQLE